MKIALLLATIPAACIAVSHVAQAGDPKADGAAKATKGTFVIQGLHCPPCARTVESSLAKTKGVQSVRVDWNTKNARLTFDEQVIAAQDVARAIAGTPHMMGGSMRYTGLLALKVPSLKDDATGAKVKNVLENTVGVAQAWAYPQQQSVVVAFGDKGSLRSQDLIAALAQAGIEAADF